MIKDSYKTAFKEYLYFNRYDLSSHENKSIYINIHDSMYKENDYNADDERKANNINENYMSVKFLHYRNNSMINQMKNLNKSKSNKNYNSNLNINHGRSLSAAANVSSYGPNQAFWEASIYAKYRKHLKKNTNNKIILNKQKYCVNPNSNIKTNNNSLFIQSNNDNNLTSNNVDIQNSKVTDTFLKNENSSMNKNNFSFKIKV